MILERLQLLASLYRARLDSANAHQKLLDDKARWLLTVTVPSSAALVAYLSAGSGLVLAPSILLIGFMAASILAAIGLLPRDYEVGIKVPVQPDDYRVFLEDEGDHRVVQFEHANILEIANAVRVNEAANDRKGRWVQRAMWTAVLSPLAATAGLVSLLIPFLRAALAVIRPVVT